MKPFLKDKKSKMEKQKNTYCCGVVVLKQEGLPGTGFG
jgi:hypothetical protein